jgi:hypothetical protein
MNYLPVVFYWGMFGSVAVEIARGCLCFDKTGKFPARYSKVSYWAMRVLLALVGGGMAWGYGIDNAVLALHLGACTPLLLERFANSTPLAAQETG